MSAPRCYHGGVEWREEGGVSLSQVSLTGRVFGSLKTNHRLTIGNINITKPQTSKRISYILYLYYKAKLANLTIILITDIVIGDI